MLPLAIGVFAVILLDELIVVPWSLRKVVRTSGLRPTWLCWVPGINASFAPRLADASVLSWGLLFVPVVNVYAWWDWWSDVAADWSLPRPNVWALGMFVPFLDSYQLRRLALVSSGAT